MAAKHELSSKITAVMQFLIFHPFNLVLSLFISYHYSHLLKIFTNPNTHKNARFISRAFTPHNRAENTLNLLKSLNFAFSVELQSTMGRLAQTPEIL